MTETGDLQHLKYLLSGLTQKKFADPGSREDNFDLVLTRD